MTLTDDRKLAECIAEYRKQEIDLDKVLKRVAARGGPITPWRVDLDAGRATLELMWVDFYFTADDGFAPNSYGRMDGRDLNTESDCALLEDAYACIAKSIAK